MFAFQHSAGSVDLAFTDRHGGLSGGAWSSLNFGTSNGDDPDLVDANMRRVADEFGVPTERLVRLSQYHGANVIVADQTTDMSDGVPAGDALVTATPGVALLVRVADCTPVVLADESAGVVGVVHAGRRGMADGVTTATVAAMRDLGASSISAWIGPRACGDCYEVPEQMRAEVTAKVPQAWAVTSWGTPALDVGAGVAAQLGALDIRAVDLAGADSMCTIEDDRFFSYRRQGQQSGRLGALVRCRP